MTETVSFTAAIFVAAGFLQGFAGFGAGLLAVPLLLLRFDITVAVPVCVLASIVLNAQLCVSYRDALSWGRIMPLLLGSIPGLILGSLVLVHAPPVLTRSVLGGILVAYGLWGLWAKSATGMMGSPRPVYGYAAGMASGAMGAAFSANGPAAIVYVSLTDWPKNTIKGTLAGYFLANNVATLAAEAASDLLTLQVALAGMVGAAGIGLGGWMGVRACSQLGERDYRRAMFALLFLMGGNLLVDVMRHG